MSIIEKKDDLIEAIKSSPEYRDYLEAKALLAQHPEQQDILDEYKKKLLESQLGQFLGEGVTRDIQEELDEIYQEISSYGVINAYLMAEYRLKNMLSGIYQDLSHIIEASDGRSQYYL